MGPFTTNLVPSQNWSPRTRHVRHEWSPQLPWLGPSPAGQCVCVQCCCMEKNNPGKQSVKLLWSRDGSCKPEIEPEQKLLEDASSYNLQAHKMSIRKKTEELRILQVNYQANSMLILRTMWLLVQLQVWPLGGRTGPSKVKQVNGMSGSFLHT